jgi:hypothetical protein
LTCYSLLLGILLAKHVLWTDEIHAWQLAVYSDSLVSLFRQLPFEGHGALWYLLLRLLGAFWKSPHAMIAVHWLIASLSAYLLLWYCPLPRWQRIACCFGYYLMFEYGVICRDYALGVLLSFVFASMQVRRKGVISSALVLALLIHVNPFSAFLAISLLAWLVFDRWRKISRAALTTACAIVAASAVVMVGYISSPYSAALERDQFNYLADHLRLIPGYLKIFLNAAIPVPQSGVLHFWNTTWSDSIGLTPIRKAIQYLGTALSLTLAGLAVIHRRSLVALYLTGTVLIDGFVFANSLSAMRFLGHWFILVLLCCWLDTARVSVGHPAKTNWQSMIRRFVPALIFALQPVALIIPLVSSLQTPFSATAGLVRRVLDAGVHPDVWSVAEDELAVALVSAASGLPVYSPKADQLLRFSPLRFPATSETMMSRLGRQLDGGRTVLLCLIDFEEPGVVAALPSGTEVVRKFTVPQGVVEIDPDVGLLLRRLQLTPATVSQRGPGVPPAR